LADKGTLNPCINIDKSIISVSTRSSFTGSDADSEDLNTEYETLGSLIYSEDLQETTRSDLLVAKDNQINSISKGTSSIMSSVTDQDLIPQGKKFAVIVP
jgi:hypothetical protein